MPSTKPPVSEKQAFYSGFLFAAEERGLGPVWAAMAYREQFGIYPQGLEKTASKNFEADKLENRFHRVFVDRAIKEAIKEVSEEVKAVEEGVYLRPYP
jgi:hypothetical protein